MLIKRNGFIPAQPQPNFKKGGRPNYKPGFPSLTPHVHPLTNYYFKLSIVDLKRDEIKNDQPGFFWLVRKYRLLSDESLNLKKQIRKVKLSEKMGVKFT